ncbi:hypothetical protein [Echinicola shivajiensis]|uniref:hypothetical protein n=1 Tax=Echinicola shivajiensis TaxID=1035916 RepID=UPI001BFC784C|nr:hypothetical protein [Echinicola shivajiensis]
MFPSFEDSLGEYLFKINDLRAFSLGLTKLKENELARVMGVLYISFNLGYLSLSGG